MRKDLNKQLCERERILSDDHYGNYRHMKEYKQEELFDDFDSDYDERNVVSGGHRESMTERYKVAGNWKELNENLNPLWGVIRKNVGRKWDDIYGELCDVFDRRSVINQHILDHLSDRVAIKTRVIDNEICYSSRYTGAWTPINETWSLVEYYVDPETGILCKNENYKSYNKYQKEQKAAREAEVAKYRRKLSEDTELVCLKGEWYEIKYKMQDGKRKEKDILFSVRPRVRPNYYTEIEKYVEYELATYCYTKRQLSSKEIKQHGLR